MARTPRQSLMASFCHSANNSSFTFANYAGPCEKKHIPPVLIVDICVSTTLSADVHTSYYKSQEVFAGSEKVHRSRESLTALFATPSEKRLLTLIDQTPLQVSSLLTARSAHLVHPVNTDRMYVLGK